MSRYDETYDNGSLWRLHYRWLAFLRWLHRCPECGARGRGVSGPRWENDRVAQMLGIARYGCPRCGHGSIEERDGIERLLKALAELDDEPNP